MKVSIIIPAYNAENFISKSLESAINQVYKNIEIIIVDDASTDNTAKIIKQYASEDNRIIAFYQKENKGVSAARNIGLKAASGDYIVFLDSDDELTKDAIRRMIDTANNYNADFIDSYHLLYYKKKNGKIVSFTEKKVPTETKCYGTIKDNINVIDMYTYITGKLIKKELIKDLTFDENLSRYEDLVFEHELKTRIKNYCMMYKPIYFYYQREDSLVNTLGKKHLCYLEASKRLKDIYKDYDINIKQKIEAMAFTNMILTLFTKVIKNDDSFENNLNLISDNIDKLILIFPNYEDNPLINKLLKKKINQILNDKNKLSKLVKMCYKINFIPLYFKFISVKNKYELKDPLA